MDDTTARIEELLARMTLEEKVGQLNMPLFIGEHVPKHREYAQRPWTLEHAEALAAGTHERGLGPVGGFFGFAEATQSGTSLRAQAEVNDRLQALARDAGRHAIPLLQIAEGTHGVVASGATVFPEGLALGSTWDLELVEEVYAAIAREARATGVHLLCTIMAEPIREPRLGRNCEGFAEDPYLVGRIVEAIVAGAQGDDPSAPDKVGVLLTDFPGSSEPLGGLERGAMPLSERTLRETFVPIWIAGIESGALAVMATYNAIDGVPAHASERLMRGLLRDELGFRGLTVSEGFGLETLQYDGIVETQKEAGALGMRTGIDVSITYEEAYRLPLIESVRDGSVEERLIDEAVRRVLEVKQRLGLFDDDGAAPEAVADGRPPEHRELALRAAREGIVLLKNNDALLPLSRDLGKVAVVGPLAEETRSLLGDYAPSEVPQPVATIRAAIAAKLAGGATTVHERGCEVLGDDRGGIAAAVEAAGGADVAIVAVGEVFKRFPDFDRTSSIGELADVASLDLSGAQQELVEAVHATGTPTVVVLINGRALSVRWIAEHVPAIVEGFLPGECGAEAIADVLFGDHDPSGRLPVSFPVHVGQLPIYYNHRPWRDCFYVRDMGYVDMPTEPLFPFGHGLSYTDFEYGDLAIDADARDALVEVSVAVENVGRRAGQEVVQLYVGDRWSSVSTAVRQLCGFAKVALEPGQREVVRLAIHPEQLALYDQSGRWVVEPGDFDVEVGRSSGDIRLRGEFAVASEIEVGGNYRVRGTAAGGSA